MLVSKYCASGNDFLIFHSFVSMDRSKMAIQLCNRFYGIGADGLVVILPIIDKHAEASYKWEFYNSDGSLANMCGNASRAVSLYAYHNHLATLKHSFLSGAGIIDVEIKEILSTMSAKIQTNLGKFTIENSFIECCNNNVYEFELITITIPHLVCFVSSQKDYYELVNNIEFLSSLRHKYDSNVNIAFKKQNYIYYATFERGIENITQACGTGAGAVYIASKDYSQEKMLIPPSKESLIVSCVNNEIHCSGIANKVCDCIIDNQLLQYL